MLACISSADVTPCHQQPPPWWEHPTDICSFWANATLQWVLFFLWNKACFAQSPFLIQRRAQRTFFSKVHKWLQIQWLQSFAFFPPSASYQRQDSYCYIMDSWCRALVNLLEQKKNKRTNKCFGWQTGEPFHTTKCKGLEGDVFFFSVFLYSLPGAVQPQSLNKVRCIVYAHNLKSIERFLERVYLQQQMVLWGRRQDPTQAASLFPKGWGPIGS